MSASPSSPLAPPRVVDPGGNRYKPISASLPKRDFQQHEPPLNAHEFYASYDPSIGVGTALFLMTFFALLVGQVAIKWAVKKIRYLFAWRACNVHKWQQLPSSDRVKRSGRQV